jgi:Ulp1 family protease
MEGKDIVYIDSWLQSEFYDAKKEFFLSAASQWLQLEMADKKPDELDDYHEWSVFDNNDQPISPQQDNGIDCGIYVIFNACLLSKQIPLDYKPSHIEFFRRTIATTLCTGSLDWLPTNDNYFTLADI